MFGLDKVLMKRVITFATRRGLTALGVLAIDRGWVDAGDWAQLSLALAPMVADLAWSLYDKAQAAKKVTVALALPAGTSMEKLDALVKAGATT